MNAKISMAQYMLVINTLLININLHDMLRVVVDTAQKRVSCKEYKNAYILSDLANYILGHPGVEIAYYML